MNDAGARKLPLEIELLSIVYSHSRMEAMAVLSAKGVIIAHREPSHIRPWEIEATTF